MWHSCGPLPALPILLMVFFQYPIPPEPSILAYPPATIIFPVRDGVCRVSPNGYVLGVPGGGPLPAFAVGVRGGTGADIQGSY